MSDHLQLAVKIQRQLYRDNQQLIQSTIAQQLPFAPKKKGNRQGKAVSQRQLLKIAAVNQLVLLGDHFLTSFAKDLALTLAQMMMRFRGEQVRLVIAALTAEEIALFARAKNERDLKEIQKILAKTKRWGENLPLAPFAKLISAAKKMGVKVIAAEALTDNLKEKDDYLEKVILNLRPAEQQPLIVLLGALRLAGFSQRISTSKLFKEPLKIFSLAVNPEENYWSELLRERQRPSSLLYSKSEGAIWLASPLISQQIFIDWAFGENRWFEVSQIKEATDNAAKTILSWFRPQAKLKIKLPEVYLAADEGYLTNLMSNKHVSKSSRQLAINQLCSGESVTLYNYNRIALASPSYTHLAEELTHWLRLKLVREGKVVDAVDYFARMSLHEALAFIGSRLLSSNRIAPNFNQLKKGLSQFFGFTVTNRQQLVKLINRRQLSLACAEATDEERQQLSHLFGYYLGNKLFRQSKKKFRSKSFCQKLFEAEFGRGAKSISWLKRSLRQIID